MTLNSKGGFYANMGVESQQHNWGEKNQNRKVSSEIFIYFFLKKQKKCWISLRIIGTMAIQKYNFLC